MRHPVMTVLQKIKHDSQKMTPQERKKLLEAYWAKVKTAEASPLSVPTVKQLTNQEIEAILED